MLRSKQHMDSKPQMESEVKALKKELESTRSALKVQVARCRNLVAAFSKKLAEKDAQMKACKVLRERELGSVLRALIVLEARLRREQKSIRAQLADRDNIINSQRQEIERLKARPKEKETENEAVVETMLKMEEDTIKEDGEQLGTECYAKPDLISSLGIEERLEEDSPTPSLGHYEMRPRGGYETSHDSLSSDTASTRSCLGDTTDSDISSPQMKGVLSVHDRSAFSPIGKSFHKHASDDKHLYESPKNDDYTDDGYYRDEDCDERRDDPCARNVKHLPSALLQEVRIGTRSGDQDEYQDNPVLQCVNQILLKDQEDFLEEQRSLRIRGVDQEGGGWPGDCDDVPPPEEPKKRPPPAPAKGSHLHHREKASLTMSHRLSLARISEYDRSDIPQSNKHPECKKSLSLTDLTDGKLSTRANPPLPPKPNRLSGSKKVEFGGEKRRDVKPTTVEFHNPPMVLLPPQPVRIDTTEIDIINKQPSLPMSILEPMDQGPDNELYVISNSALDDDIVQHLQGRMVNGSGLEIGGLNSQLLGNENVTLHTRTQHSNVPNGLLHPNHKTKNKGVPNNVNLFSASNGLFNNHVSKDGVNGNGILKTSRNNKANKVTFKTPPKSGIANAIKVASPVATLLTSGKAQEAPVKAQEVSPSVSQMVRRFEDLGTTKPAEDGTPEEGGEKESTENEAPVTVSYDNFLEATGLSQKSIMTPSRMLSNHKSVMKPKDVKHRSKVKAAAIVEKCMPPQVVGPTIKYWTEPYL